MKDIIKSFLEVSKERIKNPLIGTFVISWIAINWKPISIFLFSNQNIENKIKYIEELYTDAGYYLIIPIIIAFCYVIFLPILMWGIETAIKLPTIWRKENMIQHQVSDYKGKTKLAKLERDLELVKANNRDKADLNKHIEQLQSQLDERDKEIKSQSLEIEKLEDKILNFSEEKITDTNNKYEHDYEMFKESDLFPYLHNVGIEIRNKERFPFELDKFIKEKFITQNIIKEVKGDKLYYTLTDKGSYFWKKYLNNLILITADSI